MEIWKDIEGYEGLYQVSSLGNVRSLDYNHTKKSKVLKQQKAGRNYEYLSVALCKQGTVKRVSVHRLVASAFIENKLNKPQINHKNKVTTDNRVSNLEWCTNYENQVHAWRNGERKTNKGFKFSEKSRLALSKSKKGSPNLHKRKKVLCVETGEKFDSITLASNIMKLDRNSISLVCLGKRKSVGKEKYTFKYID